MDPKIGKIIGFDKKIHFCWETLEDARMEAEQKQTTDQEQEP